MFDFFAITFPLCLRLLLPRLVPFCIFLKTIFGKVQIHQLGGLFLLLSKLLHLWPLMPALNADKGYFMQKD